MSKKLGVYPRRVALILILISVFLYVFFLIWPITYSIYIAFTNANSVNIASDLEINELKSKLQNLESYLIQNKEMIINKTKESISYISLTINSYNDLKAYTENLTVNNFSLTTLDYYRNQINQNLTSCIYIVTSNSTYLYYYTDLRNNLNSAYSLTQQLWSNIDSVLGFKLSYSQDDINKVKNILLNGIDKIIFYLNNSLKDFNDIINNYNQFINISTQDIANEIDRLSLKFIGLKNFYTLFSDARFPYSIFKTLLFIITSVPLKILAGLFLAFIFSSPLIYGKKIMRAMLLIPWALPVLLSVTTWRILFVPGQGIYALLFSGISNYDFNTYLHEWDAFLVYNIVETWLAYPFVMTVTMGAIASIPKEYIEAAYVDGSSVFTRFRRITLPMISRPLLFAAILTTGASLQAFMVPLLINNGGPTTLINFLGYPPTLGNSNEIIILYGYNRAWLDQQYGLSTASFLVAVLILFIFAVAWFYLAYRKGFSR